MKKWVGLFMTVVLSWLHCACQYPRVDMPGTEVRTLTSKIVVGQEYKLEISLPSGYEANTKKYPVVYVMDSQWDFPLVKSIYGEYYYDGFIPELIIVGVTWGGANPNPDSLRARDYTPATEKRLPQSGGADGFLSFMKEELFPFVESNYRTQPDNRTLIGCSLGGLFTLYTLFTHTNMFTGYISASPAVGWDNEVLYRYEKEFAQKNLTKPVRLYMTVGDVERGRSSFEKIAKQLKDRHYATVNMVSKVLENTGHSGTKSETYTRGLQHVFQKPKLKLTDVFLNKYTGTYKMQNGNTVELKNEDRQLVLYFSPAEKFPLFAASETGYYSTSEFLNIYFKTGSETIDGFQLERFGDSQYLTKIK